MDILRSSGVWATIVSTFSLKDVRLLRSKYFDLTAHDAEHREVVALRGIAHMLPHAL